MKSLQVEYVNSFNAPCFLFKESGIVFKQCYFLNLLENKESLQVCIFTVLMLCVCKLFLPVNFTIYILGKYDAYKYITGDKVKSLR